MTEEALLAAVLASPDDDGPRLVYADWLAERGDVRGEFITLQCKLAKLPWVDVAFPLLQRQKALLAAHSSEWLAELGLLPEEGTFRRGFVEDLRLDDERFCTLAPLLGNRAPIRSLRLALPSWEALVPVLRQLPHLRWLAELDLSDAPLEGEGARLLAQAPELGVLTELDLTNTLLDGQGVGILASAPALAQLTVLRLADNDLGPQAGAALARSLKNLTSLELGSTSLGDEGVAALVRSPHLARLEWLLLYDNDLGPEAAVALAEAAHLASLDTLMLRDNHLGDEGARALVRAPWLPGLRYLDLSANGLGLEGAAVLAGSALRDEADLQIADNSLDKEGRALLRSRFGDRLAFGL